MLQNYAEITKISRKNQNCYVEWIGHSHRIWI